MGATPGIGILDYLTSVTTYLDALESSLYKMIVAVIAYVDALVVWDARALQGLAAWNSNTDHAQLGVDNVIAQVIVGGVLGGIVRDVQRIADAISKILQKGEIQKIWNWLKRIWEKLKRWAEKLKKNLENLKNRINDYYNTYIKPFMDLLQRIRKVLFVFRLLGFKWAKKLDQDIAKLEADINKQFLEIEGVLNTAVDWITFVTDPLGVFNPILYTLSAIQSIGDLFNALWLAQTVGSVSGPTIDQQAAAAKYTHNVTITQIRETAASGLLPDDTARLASIQSAFKGLGYTG
jgi:hypothetical protein